MPRVSTALAANRTVFVVKETVFVPSSGELRADQLVQQRRVGVRRRNDRDVLVAGRIGDDAVVRDGERIGHFAFAQEITSA